MTRRTLIALPLAALIPAPAYTLTSADLDWLRRVNACLACITYPKDHNQLASMIIDGLLDQARAARNPREKARAYALLQERVKMLEQPPQ